MVFQNGIKTDAPPEFLWCMMRAWAKKEGKGMKNLSECSPGRWVRGL